MLRIAKMPGHNKWRNIYLQTVTVPFLYLSLFFSASVSFSLSFSLILWCNVKTLSPVFHHTPPNLQRYSLRAGLEISMPSVFCREITQLCR